MTKKVVAFGEVLLRFSTQGYLKFSQAEAFNADYGGSELNVLTTIAHFGMQTEMVTRLPENDIAQTAIMEMRKHNVSISYIARGGDRLGLYFLEKGASVRGSKIIYDRAHSSFANIEKGMIDWKEVFKDATWFHWSGITPGVSQGAADACMEAIEVATELGLTISTDFNYRANLWNYGKTPGEIMEKMVSKCHVILAGDYASEQYFNIVPQGTSEKELQKSLSEKLKIRFPNCQKIVITHRKNISAMHNVWSAVLYDGKELIESTSYDITDIVDRIGAGDSFMGALIYGLNHFEDEKALNFAVAASCLKHTIYGDANLVSKEDVVNLMDGDTSGRVKR
ncbi:sugar kinase [Galbibacter mesophilus]|uniref:sugar kinase n=1 Tax=Galbibacter mesophilus TaxID=379069 RepID=UPI00191DE880|nr:sugar kinase [Galbibacter mesophilus]MCM5663095.1 sugar kinase [Galbibacter mesophilus]